MWLHGSGPYPSHSGAEDGESRVSTLNCMLNLSKGRVTSSRRGPLGNHEFAAMLLFERHGRIESDDRAFHFAVVRRLRRDPLQPQSGSCHERKERAAMFGREADNLI